MCRCGGWCVAEGGEGGRHRAAAYTPCSGGTLPNPCTLGWCRCTVPAHKEQLRRAQTAAMGCRGEAG